MAYPRGPSGVSLPPIDQIFEIDRLPEFAHQDQVLNVVPFSQVVPVPPGLPRGYIPPQDLFHSMDRDRFSSDVVRPHPSSVISTKNAQVRGELVDTNGNEVTIVTLDDAAITYQQPGESGTNAAGVVTPGIRKADYPFHRQAQEMRARLLDPRAHLAPTLHSSTNPSHVYPPGHPMHAAHGFPDPPPPLPRVRSRRGGVPPALAPRKPSGSRTPRSQPQAPAFVPRPQAPAFVPRPHPNSYAQAVQPPRATTSTTAMAPAPGAPPIDPYHLYAGRTPFRLPLPDSDPAPRPVQLGSPLFAKAINDMRPTPFMDEGTVLKTTSTAPSSLPPPTPSPVPSIASRRPPAPANSPQLQYPGDEVVPRAGSAALSSHPSMPDLETVPPSSDEEDMVLVSDSEDLEATKDAPKARARRHFSTLSNVDELDSDGVVIDKEDLPGEDVGAKPEMTFKEILEKAEEEFEPHNEIESDYDTDRDAIPPYKAFRAARARGRHDGMREARKREWMTHPDSDFVQVAKRGKYKKHLGHFRGNPMLHKREREQLCELHAYFSRYRTADPQRNGLDDTDTILALIDTSLKYNAAGEYGILLHSQCMQNVFGAPGEYSAYSIHN